MSNGVSDLCMRVTSVQLAHQGLDVVLMSRSEEKLQKVANEIKEKHGRKTLVIPVDFSAGQAIYPAIAEQLRNLDIGVLGVYPSTNNPCACNKFAYLQ